MPQDEDLLTESFSARRKCFSVFQKITVASNLIFGLFALLLIVLGGIAVKALNEFSYFAKVSIPAGLIVLGIILLAIIVLGLFGSFRKNTKALAAYFVLLFLFIICEFGVGGGAYSYRSKIPSILDNSWSRQNDIDKNQIQYDFGCCGWHNLTDSPGSKCPNATQTNTTGPTGPIARVVLDNSSMFNFTSPCESILIKYFDNQLYAAGTAGIVFAVLQLLAFISSIIVFSFIKIEQRRSQDERF